MSDNNELLRHLLWIRHGCPITALYGDDGEMSCNRCGIDFKRNAAEQIDAKFVQNGKKSEIKLVSFTNHGVETGYVKLDENGDEKYVHLCNASSEKARMDREGNVTTAESKKYREALLILKNWFLNHYGDDLGTLLQDTPKIIYAKDLFDSVGLGD